MHTNSIFVRQSSLHPAQTSWVGILLLVCGLATHGAVVTDLTEAALREAIAAGGTVTFAVDGTIPVASTLVITSDVVLNAAGHQVTISGGQNVGVFRVNPAVHFGAMNLAIANGRATNGGALYNDGGIVDLVRDLLTGNVATNANGQSCGGAIFNASGTINATHCTFTLNGAVGWAPGAYNDGANGLGAAGAAIFNLDSLNVTGCSFVQNSATGGAGMWGSSGLPGGGNGGNGGSALGGAIYSAGPLTLNGTLVASNTVLGGVGGVGGAGLSAACAPGHGGAGGAGGNAYGAGLYATGSAIVVNCTIAWNKALSGIGGAGGFGQPGFCHGQTIPGTPGGPGVSGTAQGGIYESVGSCILTNCTLGFNRGGGILGGTAVGLVNTLLYSNEPGGNSIGQPVDLGHNISSDASCAFTNVGSMNNTDPGLAPLAANGGPTWTMALLWGSPAIDTGDTASAPPTDQRGYPRPLGFAADIGAFEYGLPVFLRASVTPSGRVDILVCAAPGQICRLLASYDLVNWMLFGINTAGPDGAAFFQDNTKDSPQRFYRAMLP
jgi:hypothetical protein